KTVYGANVLVFEGILPFVQLLDMKVFVDTDSDIRLVRRLQRDIMERGRDIVGVIKQYNKFVKPAFEQYIEPTVQVADIVVPRGGENFVALDLIVQHVHSQLEKVRDGPTAILAAPRCGFPTPGEGVGAVSGWHSEWVNKDTTRDEFIFYSKRLMRLLIEHALSFLPLKVSSCSSAGATAPLLSPLGHPHSLLLPFLQSPGSHGSVLQDHDVQEDRIFLLSLLMAEMGVHSVAYAFPRVHIITTAVDKRINEEFHIIPGIGNFGDRYFGTD
ncbi:UCKL1 protein, partial [Chloroceryle aenea]|nr:UCKL1 protein [Chloroceryle aenea]